MSEPAEIVIRAIIGDNPRIAVARIREFRKVLDVYEKQVLRNDVSRESVAEMGRIYRGIEDDAGIRTKGRMKFESFLEKLVEQEKNEPCKMK